MRGQSCEINDTYADTASDVDSVLRLFEAVCTVLHMHLAIYELTNALREYPEVASLIFGGLS
jgi:hypothetical protein